MEKNSKNIDQKIYQVLVRMSQELPAHARRQFSFQEARDQILLIKHNLNTSKRPALLVPTEQIKEEVTRIAQDMKTHSIDVMDHRILNAYIGSYQEKLSLK